MISVYRCKERIRDKHGIIQYYILQDLNTNSLIEVSVLKLKREMQLNKVKITNLTLTSDNRLIVTEEKDNTKSYKEDTNNIPTLQHSKLLNRYNKYNKTSIKYIDKKLNSKRMGRKIATALLIGLAITGTATSLTGCGTAVAQDNIAIEQAINIEDETSAADKINNAKEVYMDYKHLNIGKKVIASVDGTDVGEIRGKFIKLFDTLTFTDSSDNVLGIGDQDMHLLFDGWGVQDSSGNLVYQMKQNLSIITKHYSLYDASGNEIGSIDQKLTLMGDKVEIKDTEGNIMVTVKRDPLRDDFKIIFSDDCKLDKTSSVIIATNFMMNLKDSKSGSSHSSKSNND